MGYTCRQTDEGFVKYTAEMGSARFLKDWFSYSKVDTGDTDTPTAQ
jgi:hypothetical protein